MASHIEDHRYVMEDWPNEFLMATGCKQVESVVAAITGLQVPR